MRFPIFFPLSATRHVFERTNFSRNRLTGLSWRVPLAKDMLLGSSTSSYMGHISAPPKHTSGMRMGHKVCVFLSLFSLATLVYARTPPPHISTMGKMEHLPLPDVTCAPDDPAKCTCLGKPIGPDTYTPPAYMRNKYESLYDIEVMHSDANAKLDVYRGNVTLVVNVASA